MPTLLFENGPQRGTGIELEAGRTYSLGRDARCEVVMRDDLASRQHAKIKEFRGTWFIKDLDSRNGVLVNDRKVDQSEVRFGDKIQIGGTVMTFLQENLQQVREVKTLGGYRLLARIGRGGMGTVFRALQISLDREVALKILSQDLVEDPKFIEQFFREARAAGQLNHPHIVQVYDVGKEGNTYYYSMEYVGGGSLEDRLRKEGKIAPRDAIDVLHQAAMALEFAEQKGIVHRDIKPDNLMMTEDGRMKLADLGLALSLTTATDHSQQPILGTPHFISPEQALRREVDIRSDIYSLGATAYRMLTGRTVFQGESAEEIIRKAVKEEPVPVREVAQEVPEKLAQIVHRMLQKNPDDRPASAKELREELHRLLVSPRRTRLLITALAVAVIAIGVSVALALRGPKTEVQTIVKEDEASKRQAFEASSQAEQARIELRAVRDFYRGLVAADAAASQTQLRDHLSTWVKEYGYLEIDELIDARRKLQAVEESIAQELALRAKAEEELRTRLEAAAALAEKSLGEGDAAHAILAGLSLDPEAESAAEQKQQVLENRQRIVADALEKARAWFDESKTRVETQVAEGQLENAIRACDEGLRRFPAPPEQLPEPYFQTLMAYTEWFAAVKILHTDALASAEKENRSHDDRLVIVAVGDAFRKDLLSLDFAHAEKSLEDSLLELRTEESKAALRPYRAPLAAAASLFDRFFALLKSGSLPTEPLLKVGDMRDGGEIIDFDSDRHALRVRVTSRSGANTTTPIPLQELATPASLRQLFHPRLSLKDEEILDLADAMITLQVARWAEDYMPLRASMERYDEQTGWTEDLAVALSNPDTGPDLLTLLNQLVKDLSDAAAHEKRIQELRSRLDSEQACATDLRSALSPFLKGEQRAGWSNSAAQIRQVLAERRQCLLLQMIYPLLDATNFD